MNKFTKLFFVLLIFFNTLKLSGLDFWQYPEMAEKHAIFVGCFPFQFSFYGDQYFDILHPIFFIDYLLPVGLPFSLGASINPFDPALFSFGLRAGYHINFNDEKLDVYFLYTVDIKIEESIKDKYPGKYTSIEFGGRIGFRRLFGDFICLNIETGFLFQYVFIGITIKCN